MTSETVRMQRTGVKRRADGTPIFKSHLLGCLLWRNRAGMSRAQAGDDMSTSESDTDSAPNSQPENSGNEEGALERGVVNNASCTCSRINHVKVKQESQSIGDLGITGGDSVELSKGNFSEVTLAAAAAAAASAPASVATYVLTPAKCSPLLNVAPKEQDKEESSMGDCSSATTTDRYYTKGSFTVLLPKTTFPLKLWDLVEHNKTSLVQWSQCGKAILLDTRFFNLKIQEFFPGEFGEHKLRNFCRQLRVYDFNDVNPKDLNWHRFSNLITMAPYIRVHYHHFFRRGHSEDLVKIVRVRDVMPRGRTKPKNPRPRDFLPGPTGTYYLDLPPASLIDHGEKKVLEEQSKRYHFFSSQNSKPAEASPLSNMLEEVGQEAILAAQTELGPNERTLGSFCKSLCLNPTKNPLKATPLAPCADLAYASVVVKTESDNTPDLKEREFSTSEPPPAPIASSSPVNTDHSVSFSIDTSTPFRMNTNSGPRIQDHARNSRKATVQKELQAQDRKLGDSTLVLVPCLRTDNLLIPLTFGSQLSKAGVDFLRECPDFKQFLKNLTPTKQSQTTPPPPPPAPAPPRPVMCDRGQQSSPVAGDQEIDSYIEDTDEHIYTDHCYAKVIRASSGVTLTAAAPAPGNDSSLAPYDNNNHNKTDGDESCYTDNLDLNVTTDSINNNNNNNNNMPVCAAVPVELRHEEDASGHLVVSEIDTSTDVDDNATADDSSSVGDASLSTDWSWEDDAVSHPAVNRSMDVGNTGNTSTEGTTQSQKASDHVYVDA